MATKYKLLESELWSCQKVFGDTPYGFCELTVSGDQILSTDDLLFKITGYSSEELLGKKPVDLPDQDSLNKFFSRMLRIANNKYIKKTESYQINTKYGKKVKIKTHLVKILNDENDFPKTALVAFAEAPGK